MLLRIEVQFDRFLGFGARSKLPLGDGFFGGPEQNRATAHGFNSLYLSIGAHDCNDFDRAA